MKLNSGERIPTPLCCEEFQYVNPEGFPDQKRKPGITKRIQKKLIFLNKSLIFNCLKLCCPYNFFLVLPLFGDAQITFTIIDFFLILPTMKIDIKCDIHTTCKIILQEQLDKLQLPYTLTGLGEIEIKESVSPEKYKELETNLTKYAIEIIDNPKNVFTQKIKDAIVEMVYLEEAPATIKTSVYLTNKLNRSYNYIAGIFSEVTFTSIQNFIILQKIERAKQEIIEGKNTLTEIAWKLNFSSVAHLSNEFKKNTGLTPTAFQRIIKKRKETNFTSQQ